MAYSEGNEFGYADLILLDNVTEEDANDNLKLRFQKGKVRMDIAGLSSSLVCRPYPTHCFGMHYTGPFTEKC